jgi:hypothetical protein
LKAIAAARDESDETHPREATVPRFLPPKMLADFTVIVY